MYMNVLSPYISLYPVCVSGAHTGQKRASDPLEPELEMVVSHCMGSGSQTRSFGRADSALTASPFL